MLRPRAAELCAPSMSARKLSILGASLAPSLAPSLALATLVTLTPSVASAVEPEVTSDTAAQFYDVKSPTGETTVSRRRLTTTLGVGVYDLYDKPEQPNGPSLSFRARLRYDADYGGSSTETDPKSPGYVPGFDRGPIDLMYGYIEGRRFLHGWLGFKLGRQYVTDSLGWWSFDGGQVKVTTPYYFAVEGYGGLEQRGGMPLSSPRWERDGVWRGSRSDIDDKTIYPSFQPNDVAPAYGAAIESAGFQWLHGRLTYRRVMNTGASNVSEFSNGITQPVKYDGTRISQERVGWGFDATLPNVGGLKGGLAYDLYNANMSNLFVSLDAYVTHKLTLSIDYDYYRPSFDADSIWNFFLSEPMNDLGLRASWDATERLAFSAGARARLFGVQTQNENDTQSPNGLSASNYFPSSGLDVMGGGSFSGRYHFGEGSLGVRSNGDFASNGDRVGLDVFGERTLDTRYILSARTGLWQWDDKLRPDRDATSFQYVVGAGYKLWRRSLVFADFEHDMNRIAGQRFRGMLWLSLAVTKDNAR
jgi:hypothetical protein